MELIILLQLFNKTVLFIISLSFRVTLSQLTGIIQKDYCSWETFNPTCKNNEVIVMKTAMYGLMEKGRCVEHDHELGCSSNLLGHMDLSCSGVKQCEIDVHSKEMKDKIGTVCPEPYLEASYVCQKVLAINKCSLDRNVNIKSGSDYIASIISKQTQCGYGNTPWVLNAKQGQQINLTLIDFAWSSRSSGNWQNRNKCGQLYGHVLSLDGNIVDMCGTAERVRHILTSSSHQVQIVLQQDLPQEVEFLIKFEAIGCPDYIPPKNTWLRKEDNNIVIGCQSTSDSWQLKCVGSHWIGVIGNCTEAFHSKKVAVSEEKTDEFTGHHVFAVAIGCVALIICFVTVTLGIYCIRRYHIRIKSKYNTDGTSELYLMPHTTWQPNVTTIARDTNNIRPNHVQTVNRNQMTGPQQTTMNTLNRGDSESVKYFVLEKPPGYPDNMEVGFQ